MNAAKSAFNCTHLKQTYGHHCACRCKDIIAPNGASIYRPSADTVMILQWFNLHGFPGYPLLFKSMNRRYWLKWQINLLRPKAMMTSSNGNIYRVTGHLCGKFTGPRWIPHTKARDAELWCFFLICVWIYDWVNNREASDLRRYRAHYDVTVMATYMRQYSEPPLFQKMACYLFDESRFYNHWGRMPHICLNKLSQRYFR